MSNSQRRRNYTGPALFSFGFRPFFLLSALWAGLAMILWVLILAGIAHPPIRFDPFSWHAHEFLFGYLGAVIAGFLLTAVPNWTGRLPVLGLPLAALVGLWLLGRVAVGFSALLDWRLVLAADLSHVLALLVLLGREIIHGRNWRNLPVLALLAVFALANGLFHWQAAQGQAAYQGAGLRLGLAAVLLMIALIGGRIIPSFTRNWLAARRVTRLPVPFGPADRAVMALSVITLAAFVILPQAGATALLMLACGAAHLWRMSRWQGLQTGSEPLLWVLHLAYGLLALGFWAEAASIAGLAPPASLRHVWLAGAIGLITLAVMSRATLGHSGRPLTAGPGTRVLYLALLASTAARLLAAIPALRDPMLHLSGGLWALAFLGFAVIYLPALAGPKLAAKKTSRRAG